MTYQTTGDDFCDKVVCIRIKSSIQVVFFVHSVPQLCSPRLRVFLVPASATDLLFQFGPNQWVKATIYLAIIPSLCFYVCKAEERNGFQCCRRRDECSS